MDEKASAVQALFARLAGRYDLANDLISFGQHRWWKRRAVVLSGMTTGSRVLDICTGTGDLAMLASRRVGSEGIVIGVDFCAPMLEIASHRLESKAGASILLCQGRSEQLPFASSLFDVCTVAFGLRNVSDIPTVLTEVYRVLKPGGCLVSLDVSTPPSAIFRVVYSFYFHHVLPWIGAIVNRSLADYTYLPTSALRFPQGEQMCQLMRDAGFESVHYVLLSGGAVAIHLAKSNPTTGEIG